ncbi:MULTISPECIES: NADH-quinone oxidoreductase subunit L [Alphaproteobacteria]|uniref:NADH-quinone oxidoreductase subunit L n=1 Tax=Seohaeicola nanhaiensis TaxID=1387282 RepID=A0ABV9KHS2_9RHOB|nr:MULTISPECIES: proton-conducting transporter membrane subunit [Rhodobacterales]MBF53179.1 NADH-quinone oxidoreductase subunit L [Actibacterium sp.]OWU66415.1 NADH dehydrogenase [Roseovarius sp. 22II1-1F6A]WOI31242.1 proton-conducting transporter membrane subunit [Sulfitobacter dubius]
MIWLSLTILAPLGAGLTTLALRRMPEAIALTGAALGLAGAIALLAGVAGGADVTATLPFLPDLPIRLVANPLTATLALVVATVAAMVLTYAAGYMSHDPERPRFFGTMLMFVAAMQLLVLSGDWITLLAAWEMIGFASYLLIGFWHRRKGVPGAAMRAFLYTRTADLGLYLAAFLLIGIAGTSEISATLSTTGTPALIAGLLLLFAAMGKSAQVPMQDWLMRAMAGPTPVSALLHSATLVAAGAILLIRTAPMLPGGALLAIGIVGGATAVIAGLMALAATDLKRLLAASTASQYGLMLIAVGAGAPVAALLHLIAHAAIKSALFLGAGVFQHDRESTDLDTLAGAGRARPGIFAGFALAALALAGLPPLAAFYSKDAILAAALDSPSAAWFLPLALAGSVLTGAYMGRALKVLWSGTPEKPRDKVPLMAVGMGVLVILAATLGFAFKPLEAMLGAHLAEPGWIVPAMGLAVGLAGLALGWLLAPARLLGPLLAPARNGFPLAGGMDALVVRPTLALARLCDRLDAWIIRRVVLGGIVAGTQALSRRIERAEDSLLALLNAVGRLNLSLGLASLRFDRDTIDRAIFGLVDRTIALGTRARRLQSGLIHREMALTVAGIALVTGVLLAAPFYF